jgi:dual specificity tyrosine-phosphorylation-regulated kinase 2/3/4
MNKGLSSSKRLKEVQSENVSMNASTASRSLIMNATWTKPLSSQCTELKAIDLINSAHHLALVLSSPRPVDKTLDSPQDLFDSLQKPISPATAVKLFKGCMSEYEQHEVLSCPEVYFLGLRATKGTSGLFNHGFDDERGDYQAVIGDHINFRYELLGVLGRGSFGQVFKVYDHKHREEQALKVIRNKSRFHNQAAVEVRVLRMLRDAKSPHVVQMREYFVFRKHLCISFELLSINLYDFLKINRLQGLSAGLVKHFAVQMLQGLSLLGKLGVIHCDLKPENILLTAANKSSIKLIDVGSSCFQDQRLYTYIQSRFYRAPEVILGGSYTTAIDIWSLGCILCELTTGVPLFPGENEHDQLMCIMEVAGVPPLDVMRRAPRCKVFFDSHQRPRLQPNSRGKSRIPNSRPLQDILIASEPLFVDFINKCLDWDPQHRLTAVEALNHIWINESVPPVAPQVKVPCHRHKLSLGGEARPVQSYSTKYADSRSFMFN